MVCTAKNVEVFTSKLICYCNRCECSHCDFMPSSAECICCKEIAQMVAKIGEANDTAVTCITGHPGFEGVCLNVWVLQAAYFQYQIQIHCLPAANKVVLGVAGSKYQSDTTSLCCEEN